MCCLVALRKWAMLWLCHQNTRTCVPEQWWDYRPIKRISRRLVIPYCVVDHPAQRSVLTSSCQHQTFMTSTSWKGFHRHILTPAFWIRLEPSNVTDLSSEVPPPRNLSIFTFITITLRMLFSPPRASPVIKARDLICPLGCLIGRWKGPLTTARVDASLAKPRIELLAKGHVMKQRPRKINQLDSL